MIWKIKQKLTNDAGLFFFKTAPSKNELIWQQWWEGEGNGSLAIMASAIETEKKITKINNRAKSSKSAIKTTINIKIAPNKVVQSADKNLN